MTRTPQDIIQAILANLEWCAALSARAADLAAHSKHAPEMGGVIAGLTKEADAYRQAISLIKTEAASLFQPVEAQS